MKNRDQEKGLRAVEREESRPDAPDDAHGRTWLYRGSCALLVLLVSAGCGTAPDERVVTKVLMGGAGVAEPVTPLFEIGHDNKDVAREQIGSFVVAVEKNRVWLMHMPNKWVHLSFHTPDRRVNIVLTDNGAQLYTGAQSSDCFAGVRPFQYEGSEDESDLYAGMVFTLEHLLEDCGQLMEDADRYRSLLKRAEQDFPAAIRMMKARVREVFSGRMERCTVSEMEENRENVHAWCR